MPVTSVCIARAAIYLIATMCVVALTACGSLRLIDNEVVAFSQLTAMPANASYRFERLPSQQASSERQTQLEAMAASVLATYGFRQITAEIGGAPGSELGSAPYSIQIGVRTQRFDRAPWDDAEAWLGGGAVGIGSGRVLMVGPFPRVHSPYYQREVHVLVRDVQAGRVVYEAQAQHGDRWNDGDAIVPAMFEAAMQGFPAPPAGPRRVNIEIPR